MMLISQPDRTIDEDMSADLFEVVISNFKVENPDHGKYRIITNNFRKTYDRPSSEEVELCHNYEKEFCESRIIDLKAMQERFPPHLKDTADVDLVTDNYEYLEERRRRLIHGTILNGVVVIWQGNWLRWTKLISELG
jgi:hypothetical protein